MSEEHRKTIHATIAALAMEVIERDKVAGVSDVGIANRHSSETERAEAREKREKERGLILRVAELAAGVLCDLNRIADAAEVIASPPAEGATTVVSVLELIDGNLDQVVDQLAAIDTTLREAIGENLDGEGHFRVKIAGGYVATDAS